MSATHIGLPAPHEVVEDCPTREILDRVGDKWSVSRTVYASVPPRVDYELTELGRTLLVPLGILAEWAETHRGDIQAARDRHGRQVG